jgi:hypothetical protein
MRSISDLNAPSTARLMPIPPVIKSDEEENEDEEINLPE